MTVLSARDLRKSFRIGGRLRGHQVDAVLHVEFDLHEGETLAIVGESGAGKSTVARLVMRLIEPDAGSIEFLGEDFLRIHGRELRRRRRSIQMVFQDPYSSLNPRFTVGWSLTETLRVHGRISGAERRRRAVDLLERVGLSADLADRLPHQLSGGQLQRISIARAMAIEPAVIVCDEAVASLDVSLQAQILELLLELQRESGVSYLFIAHDLGMVSQFADRVVVMEGGRIVESGDIGSVFAQPSHPYTQALLNAVPVIDPMRAGRSAPRDPSLPTGRADDPQRDVALSVTTSPVQPTQQKDT